ncbi:MAG: hypothetical protein WC383_06350 [Gammaproteobacteria bacterium]
MQIVNGAFVLALVLLSQISYAMDMPVRSSTREDGTRVVLYLPDEQVAKAPKWDPELEPPPFSISEAIAAAKAWAAKEYHQFDKVAVRQIEINDLGFRRKGSWYYVISLIGYVKGMPLYGGDLYVAVLMDGTIIAPRME